MANDTLKGKRIAILVTDGFEQVELVEPRLALDDAGAVVGTFGGYQVRTRLVRALKVKDIFVAIPEDLVAVATYVPGLDLTKIAVSTVSIASDRQSPPGLAIG